MLRPVVLRRTKHMRDIDGRAIVNLPSKRIENICVRLSEAETAFYNVSTLPPFPCRRRCCTAAALV